MVRFFFILSFISFAHLLCAQGEDLLLHDPSAGQAEPIKVDTKGRSSRELIRDAEVHINREQYKAAIQVLKASIRVKRRGRSAVAYRLLGLSYSMIGAYAKSFEAYQQLIAFAPDYSLGAYFECAQTYMKAYKYNEALALLRTFKRSRPDDFKVEEVGLVNRYASWCDRDIMHCEYARTIDFNEVVELAVNMGNPINSSADEYLPSMTSNNRFLTFTRNRGHEDILACKQRENGEWSAPKSVGRVVNSTKNEGMAKLTMCGRTLYFSACGWDNGFGGCDIFEADFGADYDFDVIDEVRPSLGINSDAWESQPALSCDRKTMYFVSSREGGQGGSDIWKSIYEEPTATWSEPINLGPQINTPYDEEAPFIAPDGITLYFSSDGHPGFGDADVFRSVQKENQWSTPINLGRSVNTPFREAGFIVTPDGDEAYFASATDNGKGGLDIYKVSLYSGIAPESSTILVDAYVYDAESGDPVPEVSVKLGRARTVKEKMKTDANGRFFSCIKDNAAYSYILIHKDYNTYVGADYFKKEKGKAIRKLEIYLVPGTNQVSAKKRKRKLRKNLSVYFESGKYEINVIQEQQIKKLLKQFDDKSSYQIRVTGFADDVGNKEFNISLSQKRAAQVASFIESVGVSKANIFYDGKGIVESNVPKHQKRRVEIIIETK